MGKKVILLVEDNPDDVALRVGSHQEIVDFKGRSTHG
jgi:hypothetical protein